MNIQGLSPLGLTGLIFLLSKKTLKSLLQDQGIDTSQVLPLCPAKPDLSPITSCLALTSAPASTLPLL